jgi:hypothetical protein
MSKITITFHDSPDGNNAYFSLDDDLPPPDLLKPDTEAVPSMILHYQILGFLMALTDEEVYSKIRDLMVEKAFSELRKQNIIADADC